jgi:hypothetical protein
MSSNQAKRNIIISIVYYIDKYRIELGLINGIIVGFGIIELMYHSFINSILIFILGLILFCISWRSLIQYRVNDIPTQKN